MRRGGSFLAHERVERPLVEDDVEAAVGELRRGRGTEGSCSARRRGKTRGLDGEGRAQPRARGRAFMARASMTIHFIFGRLRRCFPIISVMQT